MAVAGLVLSSLTGGELSSVLDLAIPALILGAGVIILLVSRYSVTLRRQIDRLNKLFLETLEGVRVIRAFNRQDREMERFAQANGELTATTILSGRVSALLPICGMRSSTRCRAFPPLKWSGSAPPAW